MFEALSSCFAQAMQSFYVKLFFYAGVFNWVIVLAVFVMNGTVSMELVRKMRKFIFYSFALFAVPLAATLIRYLYRQ